MSRSSKKKPFHGMSCAESEKKDKKLWHRRYRHQVKMSIRAEKEIIEDPKELSSTWIMSKDGKVRFDPGEHPREMRK